MTKFILILFWGFYGYSSIAQETPCNESLLMSIRGKWKDFHSVSLTKEITKPVNDQMAKRSDAIHQMLLSAYPEPIGCETAWNKTFATGEYGFAAVPWVYTFNYDMAVYEYLCINNKPEKNSETGTFFNVISNRFNWFWNTTEITINGQKIFSLKPRFGKWKGYDVYGDANEMLLILTRKDMLPYKPVTRKQYLAYMIHQVDSSYTKMADEFKKVDDPSVKEQAATITNSKNDILKVYRKELENSTAKNLLDSPAIVTVISQVRFSDDPDIFTTEENGGIVLITANPAYFRKDIPKYIPQFLVMRLSTSMFPGKPIQNFIKTMRENFPVEKLQAMIDK